jgi:micrococcal nuclease
MLAVLTACAPTGSGVGEPPGTAPPGSTSGPTAPAAPSEASPTAPEPEVASPSVSTRPEMPGSPARVIRVIDGDTVEAVFRGTVLVVRLIGIDTPETVAPGQAVMCYGPEATRFTRSRLEGRRVNLELDVERVDRYGRTLAYVWVDGELFNEVLVERGYASVTTYPPNVRYVERFVAAQRRAREAGRGFWGACADEGGAADGDDRCDPSYPTVCIPPPPPDLDCADVAAIRFEVRPPDPHRFDGDGDGVGCEG